MLRSTGFFRGIDCPFYREHGGDVCNRPYCHFRHSKHRRPAIDVKKQKELDSKQKEQGYDPFKPEVEEQQNGESSGSSGLTGTFELEMVNRAIEEVRSEVEREKRKLSRIGDQEYDPSSNSSLSTVAVAVATKRPHPKASTGAHLDYNPTPRSSKYTLDSDGHGDRVSSTEYVPTSVKKPVPRTLPPQLPSPPPSPKYSTNAPSKCKYILDNSKPSTDMEYDPLSNYSARIAGKKRDERTDAAAKAEGRKARKPPGSGRVPADEEYVPTAKKPRQQQAAEAQKYTLSESDEESSGTEYRPTSLSRLHRRKGSSGSAEDAAVGTGRRERTESGERGEETEDSENHDVGQPKHRPESKATVAKGVPGKSGKSDKLHRGERDAGKTPGGGGKDGGKDKGSASDTGKDKGPVRKPCQDPVKKDGKAEGKKDEGKLKAKDKPVDGAKRDGREEKRVDGKVKAAEGKGKTVERVKGEPAKREKEREKGGGESKRPKLSEKEKEREPGNKHKDHPHKNGQIDASRKEKDLKKSKSGSISTSKECSSKTSNSKTGSNSTSSNSKTGSISTSGNSKTGSNSNSKNSSNSINSKLGSSSSKDKLKKNSNSSSGKTAVKNRRQSLSLSHVDLFGDESPEEAEPMEEDDYDDDDDDEEEEEVLVRKTAAFRRGGLSKRKASELTPSSSEDEGGGGGGGAYRDEIDSGGVDYSGLQVDLDFDSDPMEECLRIFNESKDVKKEDKGRQAKQHPRDSDSEEDTESTLTTLFPGQKKRVSHFSAKGSESGPKQPVRPYRRQSAQEICYQRMQIAQQQAAQLAAAVRTASTSPSASNPSFPGERKRVAHRPNNPLAPSSSSSKPGPADAKPAAGRVLAPSKTLTAHLSIKAHTSAGILSKTSSTLAQRRVAHTPTMKSTSMKRPVIPTEFGAKVPTNIRQRYLTTFIDECIKFCRSEEVAFQMALDEEKTVYERSSSKNIYLSVAANTLTKLRGKTNSTSSPVTKSPAAVCHRKTLSHEELLGGRLAATTSFTVNRMGKQQEVKPTGASLFRKLRDYLMSEEQLQEHGYPRAHPESSGRAVIHNQPEKKISPDPFSKICCRCGAEYKININGSCVRREECNHHWGRLRRHKVSGGWETSYSCCSGAVGSPGCQVSKQHVQDGRKECVDGYVKTFDKDLPPDGNAGVYALDCEMCYTKQGLELTRVTVINSDLKVIYDTFVKPESQVVDYNTRFSGVTEEDLESATITLRDVQAVLLSMFSSESILIGHSLESDLLALKVIHSTVVDTAIVFPHRLGLPYKRALRNLMADHLKRIIQDNVEGHDSSEDASACMELMFWRIKEDAKVKR